jgi:hypothetical protein
MLAPSVIPPFLENRRFQSAMAVVRSKKIKQQHLSEKNQATTPFRPKKRENEKKLREEWRGVRDANAMVMQGGFPAEEELLVQVKVKHDQRVPVD